MHEDDIYRSSTQYRIWSYTPAALASLRANSNGHAAEKVRIAIKRTRAAQQAQNGTENNGPAEGLVDKDDNVKCLTVEEELKIVRWGCGRIMAMGEVMEPPIPIEIRVCLQESLGVFS